GHHDFFFFKQKTAYEIFTRLEFRRVLFRSEHVAAGRLALIALQYHVFLASMACVILADDAYLFMVAWETMALSSYFLVTTEHRQIGRARVGKEGRSRWAREI